MADQKLRGLKVAILATDGVEQVELTEPRKALEEAGAQVTLLAPKAGSIQAFKHMDKGDTLRVDQQIDQADPTQFDAVLLPGGALNADKLRTESAAQEFIREIDALDKPIAVICHAPWLLVSTNLVHGRNLTSYYTLQDDIRNAGGRWLDLAVVRDRNWVSSRNPQDIPQFNPAMIELFSGVRKQEPAETAERGSWPRGQGRPQSVPDTEHELEPHAGVRGAGQGAGRVEDVSGSGIYPASGPQAPSDAKTQGMASFGQRERGEAGYADHGDSGPFMPPDPGEDQPKQ